MGYTMNQQQEIHLLLVFFMQFIRIRRNINPAGEYHIGKRDCPCCSVRETGIECNLS
jgi:hypothetical protein